MMAIYPSLAAYKQAYFAVAVAIGADDDGDGDGLAASATAAREALRSKSSWQADIYQYVDGSYRWYRWWIGAGE